MISGFPKSGTTSLLNYLSQHPDIETHKQLEFSFFRSDFEYAKGYEVATKIYFDPIDTEPKVLLAKNALNIYSSDAAKRLYDHNPSVQQILLMRNPIDRAYSSYWHERRRGMPVASTFDEAIEKNLKTISKRTAELETHQETLIENYLDTGMYAAYFTRLFQIFKPETVHVFTLEGLKANPDQVCHTIFNLLNLDSSFAPDTGTIHNQAQIARSEFSAAILYRFLSSKGPVKRTLRNLIPSPMAFRIRQMLANLNKKNFKQPPMNPETRAKLVKYFEPHNAKLGDLLQMDFSDWNH